MYKPPFLRGMNAHAQSPSLVGSVIYRHVKRWLIPLCVFLFVITITFALSFGPSYASKGFGEECLSCHTSGITISTNATQVVQVETGASFWLDVNASGGTPSDMMLIWSEVSHNTYFSFTPNEVVDNFVNDYQAEGGKMASLFKITAPEVEGDYTVKLYGASSGDKGGSAEVHITVGAGGEIPQTLYEIIMGLVRTVVPTALGGVTLLGIVLYIVAWRRVPGGTV